jgi:integrase/recombinase XerD
MTKHNENNERIKRTYFAYLKEAQRHSEQSIDAVATALARFETYNRHRDFKAFHHQQAVAFKRHLAEQLSQKTGDKLSKSTVRSTLAALRAFFLWLAFQPGYRSRFSASDADYFNPSDRDSRIALASRPRAVPSLEQVKHVLSLMPAETVLDRRDRALVAFVLLTGCRDRAAVSLKLKHVDPTRSLVFQDAREVQTKFGKSITTYFFPVGDEPRQIVTDWIAELTTTHLFGLDDPLFPSTKIEPSADHLFRATGLERRHWSNADPVRRIFKQAFELADLPYFNPHSFRHTLAQFGQQRCKSAEEMKAWSQNLGHEQMLTTFTSYGRIEEHRQGEIMKILNQPVPDSDAVRDFFYNLLSNLSHR